MKELYDHFKDDTFICKTDHKFIHEICFPIIHVIGNSELKSCHCGEIWRIFYIDVVTGNRVWMNYLDEEEGK